MFEHIEIFEQLYKGGNNSKSTNRTEADHASHGRKRKGEEAAMPTNPDKGCSGKHKKNHAGHPSDRTTGAKKTCLLNGPRQSTEECK